MNSNVTFAPHIKTEPISELGALRLRYVLHTVEFHALKLLEINALRSWRRVSNTDRSHCSCLSRDSVFLVAHKVLCQHCAFQPKLDICALFTFLQAFSVFVLVFFFVPEHLIALISAAKQHDIEFIYAISPGLDITFSNPKEVAALKRKLDQVELKGEEIISLKLYSI